MLARSSWIHALGAIFGALLAAPIVLSLLGCQEEQPPPTPGVLGVLRFQYDFFGPTGLQILAADGAEALLQTVPADPSLTFVSADPTIVEIAPNGELVTHDPGTVEILAMDGDVEVDRVELTVVRAVRLEVTAISELMMPGFEQVFSVESFAESGRMLAGRGGVEVATSGDIEVAPVDEPTGRFRWGSAFSVTAGALGAGALTISTGDLIETANVMVVEPADVDEVRELYRFRGFDAAGDENTTVFVGIEARVGGVPVGGARCDWTVDGAELTAESVHTSGSLDVTFTTTRDRFVASCTIGDVTHDVDVNIADLP